MRIDLHAHAFPDAIAPGALRHLMDEAVPYAHLYGELRAYTDATLAGLTASSRAARLDISVVLPIATSTKPSHTLNDFAAFVDGQPGLRSFGSVHPRSPDAVREIHRIRELGLRGIKLHPEYQACFTDSDEVIAVVRTAAECGLAVLFHAGVDIAFPPPVHCTPEQVARLCDAVPGAHIILAHMGGYRMWEAVLPWLPGLPVDIDTSFCLPNHPEAHDLFAEIIRTIGARRVLFGTDSPWAEQKQALDAAVAFLARYGFSAEEQADILGGNAERLLDRKVD